VTDRKGRKKASAGILRAIKKLIKKQKKDKKSKTKEKPMSN